MNFSNFSQPGLKDLTLEGEGCLERVLGGYFDSGDFVDWAYDGEERAVFDRVADCEGGKLLVST